MLQSNRTLAIVGGVLLVLALGLTAYAMSVNYLFGANRPPGMTPIPRNGMMPEADEGLLSRDLPVRRTNYGQHVIESTSRGSIPDFVAAAKSGAARTAIAKLHEGVDVQEVNAWLQAARPERNIGSTWSLHWGDHDFTMVGMTTLLYLFGDQPDLLYPETIEALFEHILIVEGGDPLYTVPRSMGLVIDTENHHLMTEGSRYLKNQWLMEHGQGGPEHDNRTNGLEQWLIEYCHEMRDMGCWEYNSNPYVGYTLHGLSNLEAFAASEELSRAARHVLDLMNYRYVLGSQGLRRAPPSAGRWIGMTSIRLGPIRTRVGCACGLRHPSKRALSLKPAFSAGTGASTPRSFPTACRTICTAGFAKSSSHISCSLAAARTVRRRSIAAGLAMCSARAA